MRTEEEKRAMNRARVNRWRERHPWSAKQRKRSPWKPDLTRSSWRGMLDRCRRQTHIGWEYYGGRGIKVCERWSRYENFLADMGKRPGRQYTIHRIKNDEDYEPGNCKWATSGEQMADKRGKLVHHPHGMTPRKYERKLAANKRYRQRNLEKFRAYKKARRARMKAEKTRRPAGVKVELHLPDETQEERRVAERLEAFRAKARNRSKGVEVALEL